MKTQTPPSRDYYDPKKVASLTEATNGSIQPSEKADEHVQPKLEATTTVKPTRKKIPRKEKPAALVPTYKINLNCTLERRDAINATAASLGLTTTAYLLYCEEQSVHKLTQHLANYIETVAKMNMETIDSRLKKIEQLLKTISSAC